MGSASSYLTAIDDRTFHPLDPTCEVARIVTLAGCTFVLSKAGRVHTNARIGGKVCYTNGRAQEVKVLLGFGLVTKAEARTHLAMDAQCAALRKKRESVDSFAHHAKRLGVVLTKQQVATLTAIGKEERAKLAALSVQAEALNQKRKITPSPKPPEQP